MGEGGRREKVRVRKTGQTGTEMESETGAKRVRKRQRKTERIQATGRVQSVMPQEQLKGPYPAHTRPQGCLPDDIPSGSVLTSPLLHPAPPQGRKN